MIRLPLMKSSCVAAMLAHHALNGRAIVTDAHGSYHSSSPGTLENVVA